MREGYDRQDPTFHSPPVEFTEPIRNIGPDADKFRDPVSGEILGASDLGRNVGTFRVPWGRCLMSETTLVLHAAATHSCERDRGRSAWRGPSWSYL